MPSAPPIPAAMSRILPALVVFVRNEATGGIVLMTAAGLALVVANSSLAPAYFGILQASFGGLDVLHWINDGLMALFFLNVGLEIKREVANGQLSTWPRRVLPGIAAAGGIVVPALVYVALNLDTPETLDGWAIPAATDIAFALGVLALLGDRVPVSLKVLLTAIAIIDDLAAVAIIAAFHTGDLSLLMLALALVVLAGLVALDRAGVRRLTPYLLLGGLLWFFTLKSGVHATLAGVALAFTIPIGPPADRDRSAVAAPPARERAPPLDGVPDRPRIRLRECGDSAGGPQPRGAPPPGDARSCARPVPRQADRRPRRDLVRGPPARREPP